MIHRKLQNVVYMKKSRCTKKKEGAISYIKKGSNIGSCPQVPVENTEENCEMIWKIRKKSGWWWWWWQTFVRNVIIEIKNVIMKIKWRGRGR